ncbi:uncharacterized protein [Amphiura filiformis]|uniref:uncharacterized protein n=1 Tax=Amphiura filiformis TaxID=82378 RepID=UPI003B22837E
MWVSHVVNQFNLVLMLQLLCVLPESMIQVRAQYVCEVGQEKDGNRWRWVLPYRDPCRCTKVRFGGSNPYTPKRPFEPVYVDKPFVGDDVNKIWKHYGLDCTNIDECTLSTDNCDANSACTNTIGSFTCACNAGYIGDGITCTDDNECTSSTDNCDANAACTNTVGSFTCSCNAGYSGDGLTCTDHNECTLSTDDCDANATCTNTDGSFTCECNAGYSGDGVACIDHNECTLSTDNCDANAACTNTDGSFTCACNAGYSGDGVACTAIPVCIDYLGLEKSDIPDANILASSEYSDSHGAKAGRLNGQLFWLPDWYQTQTGPIWIQADIGYLTYVLGLITQGNGDTSYPDWVTSFTVSTFLTGANEVFVEDQIGKAIIFRPGNVNSFVQMTTTFPEPVYARIVRIYCLTKFRDFTH